MAPKIIEINHNDQPALSPIPIRVEGDGGHYGSRHKPVRRSRRQEIGLRDYRARYEEAQKKMDRLKRESIANKKMLLEMSGAFSALQAISVDYEKEEGSAASANIALENVRKKIKAIDDMMTEATVHCGYLQEEKSMQSSTIKAQDGQIRSMEDQISLLQGQLQQVVTKKLLDGEESEDLVETSLLDVGTTNESVLCTIITDQKAQLWNMEEKMHNLQNNLEKHEVEKRSAVTKVIDDLKETNAAKYAEINALEVKLRAIQEAQNQQSRQILVLEEPKSEGDAKGSQALKKANAAKYAEIGALEIKLQALQNAKNEKNSQSVVLKEQKTDQYDSTAKGNFTSLFTNQLVKFTGQKSNEQTETEKYAGGHRTIQVLPLDVIAEGEECESVAASSKQNNGATNHPDASIKITSSEDGGVEIMVGTDGHIDVSDVSYLTDSLHSGSFEVEGSTKQLIEQLEQARSKYDKLKREYTAIVRNASRVEPSHTNEELTIDYNAAAARVQELENENQKLRQNHTQALTSMAELAEGTANVEKEREGHEAVRKELEVQKAKSILVNTKYEKLRREHAKTLKSLEEEKAKHAQLFEDYDKVAHRGKDMETFEKLKNFHNLVVLKMADLGEENDALKEQRDTARQNLAEIVLYHEEVVDELKTTKRGYTELQNKHHTVTGKVHIEAKADDDSNGGVHDRYDALREEYEACLEKFRELEGGNHLDEKLKQEYAEAMAKVAVLEQSNEELKDVKDKYNFAEAKVTMLERDLQSAATNAESAKQKQEARATHLRDVIFHYKTLEQEHEEVNQNLQRLQAVIASDNIFRSQERALDSVSTDESECQSANSSIADQTKAAAVYAKLIAYQGRIKELQKQRDVALEQIKEIEDQLKKAKKKAVETMESKKAREKDLRSVLEHYKKLQQKHEKTAALVAVLEARAGKRLENNEEADDDTKSTQTETESETEVEETTSVDKKTQEDATTSVTEAESETEVEETTSVESATQEDVTTYVEETTPVGEAAQADEVTRNDETTQVIDMIQADEKTQTDEKKEVAESTPQADEKEATTEEEEEIQATSDAIVEEQSSTSLRESKNEVVDDKKEDTQVENEPGDEDSIAQLMIDIEVLRRQRDGRTNETDRDSSTVSNISASMSFETTSSSSSSINEHSSLGWKDKKIAEVLGDLQDANDRVDELDKKHKGAKAKLEIMERKLLIARREADDAKKRQEAREGNLRHVITNNKKLERDHDQVKAHVKELQTWLEHAKKEVRIREEDAKGARRRAAGFHFNLKKLQEEHEVALTRIKEQEKELEEFKCDASFVDDASNMRKFRNDLLSEKVKMVKENEEMKALCNELRNKIKHQKRKQ